MVVLNKGATMSMKYCSCRSASFNNCDAQLNS